MTMNKYFPTIAWSTVVNNVKQLTRATENTVATYQFEFSVSDSNEIDSGTINNTMYFTDYLGKPYSILSVNSNVVEISDDFRLGSPTSGHIGYIHKSAYKGNSLYLPSFCFRKLHPVAFENNNKYVMAILWGNDPNPIRISFTNTNNPSITDYQQNYADDYGENPKLQLFTQDSSNVYWLRQEVPTFNLVNGLLDSIIWDLSGNYSGYIVISR